MALEANEEGVNVLVSYSAEEATELCYGIHLTVTVGKYMAGRGCVRFSDIRI
jgi:hypothetical protein